MRTSDRGRFRYLTCKRLTPRLLSTLRLEPALAGGSGLGFGPTDVVEVATGLPVDLHKSRFS